MDFEFITEEEWNECDINNLVPHARFIVSRDKVNKFLNKKAQKAGCKMDGQYITDVGFLKGNTHESFTFTRPIEEEKPTCDHRYKLSMYDSGDVTIDLTVACNFCPNCGDKLK